MDNKEIFNDGKIVIWSANIADSKDKYFSVFNISDEKQDNLSLSWDHLGLSTEYVVKDLWKKEIISTFNKSIRLSLDRHASVLYKFALK